MWNLFTQYHGSFIHIRYEWNALHTTFVNDCYFDIDTTTKKKHETNNMKLIVLRIGRSKRKKSMGHPNNYVTIYYSRKIFGVLSRDMQLSKFRHTFYKYILLFSIDINQTVWRFSFLCVYLFIPSTRCVTAQH